jgi:hypothetical protein
VRLVVLVCIMLCFADMRHAAALLPRARLPMSTDVHLVRLCRGSGSESRRPRERLHYVATWASALQQVRSVEKRGCSQPWAPTNFRRERPCALGSIVQVDPTIKPQLKQGRDRLGVTQVQQMREMCGTSAQICDPRSSLDVLTLGWVNSEPPKRLVARRCAMRQRVVRARSHHWHRFVDLDAVGTRREISQCDGVAHRDDGDALATRYNLIVPYARRCIHWIGPQDLATCDADGSATRSGGIHASICEVRCVVSSLSDWLQYNLHRRPPWLPRLSS